MTDREFIDKVYAMRKAGYVEVEIADFFGMSVVRLRQSRSLILKHMREENISKINELKDKGVCTSEIAEALGMSEKTVKLLMNAEKPLTYEKVLEDLKELDDIPFYKTI